MQAQPSRPGVLRQVDLIERTRKQIFAATKQIFWKKEKKKIEDKTIRCT
jgi:hypothetical protein